MKVRALKTKNKILKAAIKCFTKQGVQSSSITEIAEVAGCTKPTVYAYFSSKDELFNAVVIHIGETLTVEENFSYQPEKGAKEQLVEIFIEHFENAMKEDRIQMFKAIFIEVVRKKMDRSKMEIDDFEDNRKENLLIKWFEDAQAAGVVKLDDIKNTARNLTALLSGAFFFPELSGTERYSKGQRHLVIKDTVSEFLEPYLIK